MTPDAETDVVFDPSQTLEVPGGRFPLGLAAMLLGFGVLLIWGSWHMWTDGGQMIGVVLFLFLVGLALSALPIFVIWKQRQAGLGGAILSPGGFVFPSPNGNTIPWAEISGIQLNRVKGMAFIGIGLTDAGRGHLNRSRAMNKLSKIGEGATGPGDLTIAPPNVQMPLEIFYTLLLTYVAEHAGHPWAKQQLAEIAESEGG